MGALRFDPRPQTSPEAPPDTLEKLQTIAYAEDNFGDEVRLGGFEKTHVYINR